MIQVKLSFINVTIDSKFRDVTGKTFTKISPDFARDENDELVMFKWHCLVEQDYYEESV